MRGSWSLRTVGCGTLNVLDFVGESNVSSLKQASVGGDELLDGGIVSD